MRVVIRSVLLVTFLTLIVLLVLAPRPASAAPSCAGKGPGHYSSNDPIFGANCNWPHVDCIIGHQHFEWDCVMDEDGEGTHPANVQGYQPTMCGNPICPTCCP